MRTTQDHEFDIALKRYRQAKLTGPLDLIDDELDLLLAVPSPSVPAFGQKLRILEEEYRIDVQPRHMASLYRDREIFSG